MFVMDDNFSPRVKDVITYSKEEALRLGHDYIGTEHLMLGILRDGGGKAISILNSIEVDLDNLRKKVEILNPAIIDSSSIENSKKNYRIASGAGISSPGWKFSIEVGCFIKIWLSRSLRNREKPKKMTK